MLLELSVLVHVSILCPLQSHPVSHSHPQLSHCPQTILMLGDLVIKEHVPEVFPLEGHHGCEDLPDMVWEVSIAGGQEPVHQEGALLGEGRPVAVPHQVLYCHHLPRLQPHLCHAGQHVPWNKVSSVTRLQGSILAEGEHDMARGEGEAETVVPFSQQLDEGHGSAGVSVQPAKELSEYKPRPLLVGQNLVPKN